MKLKERVLLTVLVSVCVLMMLRMKLSKNRQYTANGEQEYDILDKLEPIDQKDKTSNLANAHLLKKRETPFEEYHGNNLVDNSDNTKESFKKNAKYIKEKINAEDKAIREKETNVIDGMDPWDVWWTMVTERHLTSSQNKAAVKRILQGLATRQILEAKTLRKGTQLKVSLLLDGTTQQKVVFKPMRYPRDFIITGKIYDGFDRHNAEIAAFHLDRILGFFRAPPVVGRKLDLEKEVKPVGEEALLKTFFKNEDGDDCFYGVCYYCKKSEAACAKGKIMEGSVTIWLPDGWHLAKSRHPWQRTYNNRKARWELDPNYCSDVVSVSPYNEGPRMLDIIDTSIFDFLIGNGDRHHYETFKKGGPRGMLLHLDNAKSFGNPAIDDLSILSPLTQCCRIRKSTYDRLSKIPMEEPESERLSFQLRQSLLSDPISPVLTESHLQALDRRLKTAMKNIEKCIDKHGKTKAVIDDGL
eukprot:gene10650-19392_t